MKILRLWEECELQQSANFTPQMFATIKESTSCWQQVKSLSVCDPIWVCTLHSSWLSGPYCKYFDKGQHPSSLDEDFNVHAGCSDVHDHVLYHLCSACISRPNLIDVGTLTSKGKVTRYSKKYQSQRHKKCRIEDLRGEIRIDLQYRE